MTLTMATTTLMFVIHVILVLLQDWNHMRFPHSLKISY